MVDVIVIGAGPSGMMCAVQASLNGKKVILIDKNEEVGKKMRLSGGGRCNITNLKDTNEFVKNLPVKNGRFLYSALTHFNPYEIYAYFETLGVPLKVEDNDRVFPVSDKSTDFIIALKRELHKHKVDIKYQTEVLDIALQGDLKFVKTKNETYIAPNVVIATGGQSYPHTGSTGFGHKMAETLEHEITELFPTESPIISSDPIIISKELQGISLSDVVLRLVDVSQKEVISHQNDVLITHFGLSGPAALKLSQFVHHYLKDHKEATILLDVLPNHNVLELINEIKDKREQNALKSVKNILKVYSQQRLIDFILKQNEINGDMRMADLSNKQIDDFVKALKSFKIIAHGVKPISVAFVTGGGVSLKDINPKTLESKIIPGLYFVGEVLDLHGYTGGYNITIALSTGYTAGINIRGE